MTNRKFYIVRHGETNANVNGTFAGTLEVDLTQKGEEQAQALGVQLANMPDVTRLISSPQIRAQRTAKIALMASGRDDLVIDVDDEIRERNYGELQGLDKKAFKNEHGPLTPETLKKFGAETDDELRVRIPAAILEQLYKPGRPMFVAHSGTAKALMLELLKHKEFVRPQNGEIWCFEEIEPDQWQATVNGEIHQDPTISRQEL